VLADAVPTHFDSRGNVTDLFGTIKVAVRMVQVPPKSTVRFDECSRDPNSGFSSGVNYPSARKLIESTVPGWAVGLLIQLALAATALAGAMARTRTPAGRLSRGSRVA